MIFYIYIYFKRDLLVTSNQLESYAKSLSIPEIINSYEIKERNKINCKYNKKIEKYE